MRGRIDRRQHRPQPLGRDVLDVGVAVADRSDLAGVDVDRDHRSPASANATASGSPTYPRPITPTDTINPRYRGPWAAKIAQMRLPARIKPEVPPPSRPGLRGQPR